LLVVIFTFALFGVLGVLFLVGFGIAFVHTSADKDACAAYRHGRVEVASRRRSAGAPRLALVATEKSGSKAARQPVAVRSRIH
jgi:hypothetical protein